MAVTTEMIKALREETGAGVMDAKRALEAAGGDPAKAKTILREQGIAAAAKRANAKPRTAWSKPTLTWVAAWPCWWK